MRYGEAFRWPKPALRGSVSVETAPEPRVVWQGSGDLADVFTGALWEVYAPMVDAPEAFMYLANGVYDAEDAAAVFARYGPLSRDVKSGAALPYTTYAEPVALWLTEAARLRTAIGLRDGLELNDPAQLTDYIRTGHTQKVQGTESAITFAELGLVDADTETNDAQKLMLLDVAGTTVQEKARAALFGLVNAGLQGGVSLTVAASGKSVDLDVMPVDLRGAMWLQFTRTLIGEIVVTPCPSCGKWFAMSKESAKRRKSYCSNACKQAAFRGRKPSEADL